MKKILSLFVALVAVLSLAACGKKESTAKGYGLVHKDYVGIAEITVDIQWTDKIKHAETDDIVESVETNTRMEE